jgi:putative phosphoribosyl transferase
MHMASNDREPFADRREAGRVLAAALRTYAGRHDTVVLALPRGGVPVAFEVAEGLTAPLDVFLVRKLGTPGHPELAMGAIASGGIRVINSDVVRALGIRTDEIDAVARQEQRELERRQRAYLDGRDPAPVEGRVVILVDDGLATGSTMRAAVQAIRERRPSRIVVAVPVGAADTCREMAALADEVFCARVPEPFAAVGQWYLDFNQTSDDEVMELIRDHASTAR